MVNRMPCQNQRMQQSCGRSGNMRPIENRQNCGRPMNRGMEESGRGCSESRQMDSGRGCGCSESRQMDSGRGCGCSDNRQMDSRCGCGCSESRQIDSGRGCGRSDNRQMDSGRGCGCSENREEMRDWRQEVPTGNRRQLLSYITEVSFGAYEALLFLDTHHDDQNARSYFQENNEKRNFALKEYARLYGPLTVSHITGDCDRWKWANQPWPWEGGDC